jgi:hypothetical protein
MYHSVEGQDGSPTFYVNLLLVQMDHLPKTLLCLMNTVVEQYIEFSWASQEQTAK